MIGIWWPEFASETSIWWCKFRFNVQLGVYQQEWCHVMIQSFGSASCLKSEVFVFKKNPVKGLKVLKKIKFRVYFAV